MFLKRYLFLYFFLACGIMFDCSYGLDLKVRKQIYDMYASLNKFEGEWIDPHSLGIYDGNLEFEEKLEDSYAVHSEEIISKREEETLKDPKNFPGHRIIPKNKLQDSWGFFGVLETENNSIFALGRNLMTVSAILFFAVFLSCVFFPKTLIFFFVLIVSMLWHWMKLYQEKIAEKQNVTENLRHPNECHKADLHWYEVIYLYFSSYVSSETDCKEYYKAQLVDPFWEVSLPMAMMNAFTSTICEPMKVFATTIRFCFAAIFSGLSMLELSITLFSIFIFLLMQNGYSFSFCWGAISLHRPRLSADETAPRSLSCWGSITKSLKALFFRESAQILPSEISILPKNKKVCYCNIDDKIKVAEKPDGFQEHEKSTDNVQENANLQSGSLLSKNNNHPIESAQILPLELNILPETKKVYFHPEDNKIKVPKKPEEFQKQGISIDHVRQNTTSHSGSLHSKKNDHKVENAQILPSELNILPENKVCFRNEDDKIKVFEKPDEFLKPGKGTDYVQHNATLQSRFLHSKKNNPSKLALRISQLRATRYYGVENKLEEPKCINFGKTRHLASWKGCKANLAVLNSATKQPKRLYTQAARIENATEKPDEFLKEGKGTDNVRQSAILHSEKNNHSTVASKISQFVATRDCGNKNKIEEPKCINFGKTRHLVAWKGCKAFPAIASSTSEQPRRHDSQAAKKGTRETEERPKQQEGKAPEIVAGLTDLKDSLETLREVKYLLQEFPALIEAVKRYR